MHEIAALVAPAPAMAAIRNAFPAAGLLTATSDWIVIPLDERFATSILGHKFDIPDLEDAAEVEMLDTALTPLLRAVGREVPFPLAAVVTQYWGGSGFQAGAAISGDKVLLPVAVFHGAVNKALAAIGVRPTIHADEFDAIGLHRWRSMDALERALHASLEVPRR